MKKDDPKIAELEARVEELNNKYLRSLADYQNLEKQTQSWRDEFIQYANSSLIQKLLEVLDDLERAQEHLNDNGLAVIIDKLKNILKNNGLEELDLLGQAFDPQTAEAIEIVPGEEDHKIIKIIQRGYKLHTKVIRPAKVAVSRKE
jgi:molecular chaperone GrpE